MKYIKKVLGEDLRQYTMVVALVALIIVFNIASGGGRWLRPRTFKT